MMIIVQRREPPYGGPLLCRCDKGMKWRPGGGNATVGAQSATPLLIGLRKAVVNRGHAYEVPAGRAASCL
jgi:hypothetical protein